MAYLNIKVLMAYRLTLAKCIQSRSAAQKSGALSAKKQGARFILIAIIHIQYEYNAG